MKNKNHGRRPGRAVLGMPLLATVLAGLVLPGSAAAQAVLHSNDAVNVINSAVFYHYQKTIARQVVASVCYFDPQVEKSMRCSSVSNEQGADAFRLQNEAKKNATKWCKQAGGKKCVAFWRNGRIRYDDLSSEQREKVETALQNIASFDSEAHPLPEGVEVGGTFRDRFDGIKEYWEGLRSKRRGHNPHYAVCANDQNQWASFYMQGGSIVPENVRKMCVLKCNAISAYFLSKSDCYVIYEDGKFASEAARKAVM